MAENVTTKPGQLPELNHQSLFWSGDGFCLANRKQGDSCTDIHVLCCSQEQKNLSQKGRDVGMVKEGWQRPSEECWVNLTSVRGIMGTQSKLANSNLKTDFSSSCNELSPARCFPQNNSWQNSRKDQILMWTAEQQMFKNLLPKWSSAMSALHLTQEKRLPRVRLN